MHTSNCVNTGIADCMAKSGGFRDERRTGQRRYSAGKCRV
jgi:hypothetical protein